MTCALIFSAVPVPAEGDPETAVQPEAVSGATVPGTPGTSPQLPGGLNKRQTPSMSGTGGVSKPADL